MTFLASTSAFSLRQEPPQVKTDESTTYAKKRSRKAVVSILNKSIRQTLQMLPNTYYLFFKTSVFSYRNVENNFPKQLCKGRRIMRTAIPARHAIPISIQRRAVTAIACSGPAHR